MISKQQFKEYLSIIKELQKKQDDFDNMFEMFDFESSVCTFIYMKPISTIIKLLNLNLNLSEDDDNIGYYIWETDWGKRGKECIEWPDGRKVNLTNEDELYDFLIEYTDKGEI